MTKSAGIFIIFGLAATILIRGNVAQLTPKELPPELQYITKSNLTNWEPPKELSQAFSYYLSGFDFDNRPIWVVEIGKWDLRSYVEKGENWEKLVDRYLDKLYFRLYESTRIKATEELPVKDGVLIVDFDLLSYRQISSPTALAYFIKKVRTMVSALPLGNEIFFINVNFIATQLIELVRPLFGKDFQRIEVLGTNSNRFRPAILKVLPRDQIPEKYGGNKDFKPIQVYG